MAINEELERLIDEAGRAEVFALVRANGWGPYDTPPEWVWRLAAVQLILDKQHVVVQ